MPIVVALGGNALLKRGEPMTAENHRANVKRACEALAPVARDNEIVISHGNGPQVGLIALQQSAYAGVEPYRGADDDARAIDTRIGTAGPIATRIDKALRARWRDDQLKRAGRP